MKRLRGKLTYSNIVSTICLFLLLGGGVAWAANNLPKNSVGAKQLKKGAVTPAKLSKAAKSTIAGPIGATGPQGPAGPQGQFVDTVPSGKTLVGTYAERYQAAGSGEAHLTTISFGFRFSSPPKPHFVPLSTTPPAECPGNGLNPQATPGNLCIYETGGTNRSSPLVSDVNFNFGVSSSFGANVLMDSTSAGQGGSSGSWAATAP